MSTYTRLPLSGSTDGVGIKIVSTTATGTTLHTAHASSWDEIYCWFTNTSTAAVNVTIEFGGVSDPDTLLVKTLSLPALSGPIPLITGQGLTNSKVVSAYASVANVIIATGHVNRIT